MNKINYSVWVTAVFAGIVLISPVLAQAQMSMDTHGKVVMVLNKHCPVSGAQINANSGMAGVMVEYKGKQYHLCCGGCIEEFNSNPEKYSKIADEDAAKALIQK